MAETEKKLKILILTTPLFDYLADSLIIGLREIYGENCVEFPRKDILYGDLPCVYGRSFTLWSQPIADVPRGPAAFENVDVVIYSNYRRQQPIDWRLLVRNRDQAPQVIYVDGGDDNNVEPNVRPLFKRELYTAQPGVFSIGFGVPERLVRPLAPEKKTQLHPTHVQDEEFGVESGYRFAEESDYYDDLARSLFGITLKKGGWDCMRHYEIMAAGTVVMFKHFDQKPATCAPQCPDIVNYADRKDFLAQTGRLLTEGKPNDEYRRVLAAQREWLLANATCRMRASYLIRQAGEYFAGRPAAPMPQVPLRALKRLGLSFFFFSEYAKLRAITFVKQHGFVDFFYYKIFKKIPGVGRFVSSVLMNERPNAPV
jgi:hypothetical protein